MTTSGLAPGPVDAAGVAKGVGRKAAAGDLLVGAENLFAKRFEQHGVSQIRINRSRRAIEGANRICYAWPVDSARRLRCARRLVAWLDRPRALILLALCPFRQANSAPAIFRGACSSFFATESVVTTAWMAGYRLLMEVDGLGGADLFENGAADLASTSITTVRSHRPPTMAI